MLSQSHCRLYSFHLLESSSNFVWIWCHLMYCHMCHHHHCCQRYSTASWVIYVYWALVLVTFIVCFHWIFHELIEIRTIFEDNYLAWVPRARDKVLIWSKYHCSLGVKMPGLKADSLGSYPGAFLQLVSSWLVTYLYIYRFHDYKMRINIIVLPSVSYQASNKCSAIMSVIIVCPVWP